MCFEGHRRGGGRVERDEGGGIVYYEGGEVDGEHQGAALTGSGDSAVRDQKYKFASRIPSP